MLRIEHRDPGFTGTVTLGGKTVLFVDGVFTGEANPAAFRRAGHKVEHVITAAELPEITDDLRAKIAEQVDPDATSEQWATPEESERADL